MEGLEPKPQLTSFAEDNCLITSKLVSKLLEDAEKAVYPCSLDDYELEFLTDYTPFTVKTKIILKPKKQLKGEY